MVYFMQATEGGPVKIGHSADVDRRRTTLEGFYGKELAVLATLPGGRKEERQIHSRFAHLRIGRTEQFRPAIDLMEFIGRPLLVGANPEATEDVQSDLSGRRFASQIKALREGRGRSGLSQVEAASLFGMQVDTWRGYEYGTRRIPEALRSRIIEAWGIHVPKVCPSCGQPID